MKVGVLFPGYGSQYVGMAKELYDESRIIQEYFEEAANCVNGNFVKLCFASSDAELAKVENALPSLLVVSAALYAHVQEQVPFTPAAIAGHTSGSFAALCASGSMSLPDMLYFVSKYLSFYTEYLAATPVASVRVSQIPIDELKKVIGHWIDETVYIAVYESDTEYILTGFTAAIDEAMPVLQAAGAVVTSVLVDCLHSPMMQSVYEQLDVYAAKVDFKDVTAPLINTCALGVALTGAQAKQTAFDYLVRPVRWAETMSEFTICDLLVEIGPGNAIAQAFKRRYPEKRVISINTSADIQILKSVLVG